MTANGKEVNHYKQNSHQTLRNEQRKSLYQGWIASIYIELPRGLAFSEFGD
jgi:hypothetical protein